MKLIKINEQAFIMPADPDKYNSVLNHIDMVKKGLKKFVKLKDLNGNEHRFSTDTLKLSRIRL